MAVSMARSLLPHPQYWLQKANIVLKHYTLYTVLLTVPMKEMMG
jgi:hypothetical protein